MYEDKAANIDANTSKVYRDEPILRSTASTANFTPPRYREMRKIAAGFDVFGQPDTVIFYKQGKFMEDFEDDFDYREEFVLYFPTYRSMSDAQLRGYFSWRTRLRHGNLERTSLSFAFLYVYELLNLIGVSSPEEGFHKLKQFWVEYGEIDEKITRYLKIWLKDYVVYYNLDKSLLDDFSDAHFDNAVLTLLNHKSHDADELFQALNSLSSYNLENSRFSKLYPEDVKNVTCRVFAELSDYYDRNRKNSIDKKFFGENRSSSYAMFRSAVFCDRLKRQDFVYEINNIYRYRCQGGKWTMERFFCYKGKIQQTGALLKAIDFLMRQKYYYPSTLKTDKITKVHQNIINKEIDAYLEEKRRNALPKISIDVSKLHGIRTASLETQSKLIVEELDIFAEPEEAPENTTNLSAPEYQFMRCLLSGAAYEEVLKSNHLILSVVVDSINEKLFDTFNDTVIVCAGDAPELIEDYIDELKGIIGI